jgi:hypothetical protein
LVIIIVIIAMRPVMCMFVVSSHVHRLWLCVSSMHVELLTQGCRTLPEISRIAESCLAFSSCLLLSVKLLVFISSTERKNSIAVIPLFETQEKADVRHATCDMRCASQARLARPSAPGAREHGTPPCPPTAGGHAATAAGEKNKFSFHLLH